MCFTFNLFAAVHNRTHPRLKNPAFPGAPRTSFGDYLFFLPFLHTHTFYFYLGLQRHFDLAQTSSQQLPVSVCLPVLSIRNYWSQNKCSFEGWKYKIHCCSNIQRTVILHFPPKKSHTNILPLALITAGIHCGMVSISFCNVITFRQFLTQF